MINILEADKKTARRELFMAIGIPWGDVRDEYTFIFSFLWSVALILILNKKFSQKLDTQNISILIALSVCIGGFIGESIKAIFMTNSVWSPTDSIITFASITASSLTFSYFYIIKGRSAKK
jgi:hypothetical protein